MVPVNASLKGSIRVLLYRALIIRRIGLWGPLYYIYNKDPPQKKIVLVVI